MTVLSEKIRGKIKQDKAIEAFKLLVEHFMDQYGLDPDQLLSLTQAPAGIMLPVTIFSHQGLGSLEIITRYLRENKGFSYHEIAVLLNRDDRTIWSSYQQAKSKSSAPILVEECAVQVPLSLFASRKYSVLEALVIYLKDKEGFSFKKISKTLCRNYQTIWTTYRRGREKV